MGTLAPVSELDLTMVGWGLTNIYLARIEADLDDLLLPYMNDLSTLTSINHGPLLDHIRRVGIVPYRKQPGSSPVAA
jgi:hypothetical protein